MKKITIILALLLPFVFSSCKEDKVPVFGMEHYIHFSKPSKDIIRFSFVNTPDSSEHLVKIPVSMIGRSIDQDREFQVVVLKDSSNADPKTYEILKRSMLMPKGEFVDTLLVRLIKTPALDKEQKLVLAIEANSFFKLGIENSLRKTIYYSNLISQPQWWDKKMSENYLGPYSDIKYRALIKATGISDFGKLTASQLVSAMQSFVYYLRNLDNEGKPLYEADGKTKVISTVVYNKKI